MDLSDPKGPKGPKDCRICNRRRVKCDRSLPTCKKCESRGLQCSGYGVVLKWGQGVASRGHLAKMSVPVLPQNRASSVATVSRAGPAMKKDDSNEDDRVISSQQGRLLPSNRSPPQVTSFLWKNNIDFIPQSSPLLKERKVRRFLHHYDQVVAANMVWTEWPDNPWRDTIIPMAIQSPPLLFAVLAFAAKHISAMANSPSMLELFNEASGQSRFFEHRAIELLSQELRPLVRSSSVGGSSSSRDDPPSDRSNYILATMLVLCNVETVWPDSSVWRVHLDGARSIITQRAKRKPETNFEEDATFRFLEQEFFTANTFASITSFQPKEEDPLADNFGGVLVDFLKLLRMVTSLERQAFTNPEIMHNSGVTPTGLQMLFEDARARNLSLGSKSKFSSLDGVIQFNRLINSFYYSGLIYSHRAWFNFRSAGTSILFSLADIESRILLWKLELFQILESIEIEKPTYAQDLVWPLFIAGTEASDEREQEVVVRKLNQAIQATGFSNCQQVLEFLNALWASRGETTAGSSDARADHSLDAKDRNWIAFARDWVKQGRVILVF